MKTFVRIIGCPVGNLGIVKPGAIYRSAQADLDGYLFLREKFGLRTSLNLKLHSDREIVEAAGIRFIDRPIDTMISGLIKELKPERIEEILGIVNDPANGPVLVHCRQGHDRTGTIVACWRMKYQGWTYEESLEEAAAYGFNPLWDEFRDAIWDFSIYLQKGKS